MARRWRGFKSYSKEERHAVSVKGGRKAHRKGRAHEWDSAAAREASLKRVQYTPLESRKVGSRYEYNVPGVGWVSRQRVHQLRVENRLK